MDLGSITISQLIAWAGTITALIATISYFMKPIKNFSDRVDKIEKHQDNDNKRLDLLEKDSKIQLKTLNAILGHMQTGNNTGEMAKTKKELEDYIYDR